MASPQLVQKAFAAIGAVQVTANRYPTVRFLCVIHRYGIETWRN
jgi:hypothetical protein